MAGTEVIISEEQIKDLHPLLQDIQGMQVTTASEYNLAGEYMSKIKAKMKAVKEWFEKPVKKAKESYDEIRGKRDAALAPYEQADNQLRMLTSKYLNLQEAIRREAEEKARKAEEERARKEREKLLAQAEKAKEKGKDEKAEDLIEKAEAVYAAPIFVSHAVEKTIKFEGGGSTTQAKDTEVIVTDVKALIGECAKGIVPFTVFDIKKRELKAWVKSNPGVKQVAGLIIKRDVLSTRVR